MDTKKEESGRERRSAQRVYASFVEYCRVEDESSRKFQAFTENISAVGICILVNEEIKKDSLLLITIYLLEGKDPIETKGRVVWIRPSTFLNVQDRKHFDIGIEFVEMAPENRDRLLRYVARYSHEAPSSKQ